MLRRAPTPTPRLLLLLLMGAPLLALGQGVDTAAWLWLLLVLAAAALDWWLARDIRRVGVSRVVPEILSLGAWNPVRLQLANGTRRSVRLDLRDVPPLDFELDAAGAVPSRVAFQSRLPVGGVADLAYRARPRSRGDHQFGELYVRAAGPLGLIRLDRVVADTARTVRVYPNLRDLRKFDLLARRGALAEAGTRPLRVPGGATEFERLREYVPDDEYRRINWKATARRGKPIVNQLEAERSQNLVIMLDAGRLMGARADLPTTDEGQALTAGELPVGLTKLDHALNTALLLAHVGSVRGDRVALLAYADRVRVFLPPARGRRAFLATVQAFYNLTPDPVEPDHGLAFQFLAARHLRRSLVVLFTDLSDPESSSGLVAHLLRAGRQHQVVCVTLADPTIQRPAQALPTDAQTLYEKLVAQRLLDERAAVLARLQHHGVLTVDTDADKLSPRVISSYLELKERGRV